MCCGQKRADLRASQTRSPAQGSARAGAMPISSRPQPGWNGAAPAAVPPASPAEGPGDQVHLRYVERSPIQVRGPVTARLYAFSGAQPVQAVDARDVAALLQTRFFRQL